MKIKVCGMKYAENILAVNDTSPDFIGFIFYENSPRFVADSTVVASLQNASTDIKTVGVFVNERIEKVIEIHREYHLDYVQLHGDETNNYCASLMNAGMSIIKAFQVDEGFDFTSVSGYASVVELFLFDTRGSERGGTGRKFDWSLLNRYSGEVPFLLSGGISNQDVDAIIEIRHAQLFGVDINSRFETAPGRKDVNLVSDFIKNMNNAVRSR